MTVLEKIKRCVSLVWDFQEIYGEEDIEDFCSNELCKYSQHDEIMEYFKYIEDLEKENAELKAQIEKMKCCENCKYYKPCVTVNETIGNECEDFYNGCNNSVIAPFGKWEIKDK